jgi:hypothetical protein
MLSVVWNPWLLKDMKVIANIQRIFKRNVCIKCHLPVVCYDERLTFFNLDRRELRHFKIALVHKFKIVHGYSKFNVSVFLFRVGQIGLMFAVVPSF